MTIQKPSDKFKYALLVVGGLLLHPLTIMVNNNVSHACQPRYLSKPELKTFLGDDHILPLDAELIFEVSYDFNERDTEMIKVSIDGVEVEVNIDLKRVDLARLMHLQLPADAEEGAEVIIELLSSHHRYPQLLTSFTLGTPMPHSPTVMTGLHFFVTDIFGGARSCDHFDSKSEYIINGSGLDQEWIYADFFINGTRHSALFEEQPNLDSSGLLHLEVKHRRSEEIALADQSRSLVLYDNYGRSHAVSVTGGCQHLVDQRSRENSSLMIIEESQDAASCGIISNELNLIDIGCDQSSQSSLLSIYLLLLSTILNLLHRQRRSTQ